MHAGHYYVCHCKNCGANTGIDARVDICHACRLEMKQEERERRAEAAKEDAEWEAQYKQYRKDLRRLKKLVG